MVGSRPKHSSAFYRARFEKLATKQRWPGHRDWCYMKQGIISIRMRQALANEDNARWYEDRDRKKAHIIPNAGGPEIKIANLDKNKIDLTASNTSWADVE